MSIYDKIQTVLRESEGEVLDRCTISRDSADYYCLFRDGKRYGVGKNVCAIHQMGETTFITDEGPIEYFDNKGDALSYYASLKNECEMFEADMIPREAGEINPERREKLVAELKKYWPRVSKAWIDNRPDDYIEQVLNNYKEKEAKKKELDTMTPEQKEEKRKREEFMSKLKAQMKKGDN